MLLDMIPNFEIWQVSRAGPCLYLCHEVLLLFFFPVGGARPTDPQATIGHMQLLLCNIAMEIIAACLREHPNSRLYATVCVVLLRDPS